MRNPNHNIPRTILMLLIPGAATAAVLYFIFRNLDFTVLVISFKNSDHRFLTLALGLSLTWNIGLFALLRKIIWQYMGYVISLKECLFIRAGSLPFQAIPSFKDTGLAMALYLKNRRHMPLSEGVLSNIIVNLFSLVGLLFLIVLGCLFYRPGFPEGGDIVPHLTARLAPLVLFVGFIAHAFYFNQALGKRILFYACFKKKTPLFNIFEKNIDLWKNLPKHKIIIFFLLTTVYKLADILLFYTLAQSYQLRVPLSAILLYVPLAMMISESPANISGIGVREGALIVFFYNFAPKEILVSVAVLIFIMNRIVPIMVGFFFMAPFLSRTQLSFAKIREQMRFISGGGPGNSPEALC